VRYVALGNSARGHTIVFFFFITILCDGAPKVISRGDYLTRRVAGSKKNVELDQPGLLGKPPLDRVGHYDREEGKELVSSFKRRGLSRKAGPSHGRSGLAGGHCLTGGRQTRERFGRVCGSPQKNRAENLRAQRMEKETVIYPDDRRPGE